MIEWHKKRRTIRLNQIQKKYNWNLTDLFENKEDFYKAKEKMQKDLKEIEK